MIQVNIGNNARSEVAIEEKTMTLRECLEKHGVDYSTGTTSLDGAPLAPGDMDKTFEELGIVDKCYLYSIKKLNNAR